MSMVTVYLDNKDFQKIGKDILDSGQVEKDSLSEKFLHIKNFYNVNFVISEVQVAEACHDSEKNKHRAIERARAMQL